MLDFTDKKILAALHNNSRQSIREVARKTKVPQTTVSRRIRRLKSEGIIKKYTIEIDYDKIEKSTIAYILVNVNFSYVKGSNVSLKGLTQKLSKHKLVERCSAITGRFDMVVKVRASTISEINDFVSYIRNIDGFMRTETLIIFCSLDGPFDL